MTTRLTTRSLKYEASPLVPSLLTPPTYNQANQIQRILNDGIASAMITFSAPFGIQGVVDVPPCERGLTAHYIGQIAEAPKLGSNLKERGLTQNFVRNDELKEADFPTLPNLIPRLPPSPLLPSLTYFSFTHSRRSPPWRANQNVGYPQRPSNMDCTKQTACQKTVRKAAGPQLGPMAARMSAPVARGVKKPHRFRPGPLRAPPRPLATRTNIYFFLRVLLQGLWPCETFASIRSPRTF